MTSIHFQLFAQLIWKMECSSNRGHIDQQLIPELQCWPLIALDHDSSDSSDGRIRSINFGHSFHSIIICSQTSFKK